MVYDYIKLQKHSVLLCIWYSIILLPLYANYLCEKMCIKVVRFLTVCRINVCACATITATFMVMKSES